MALRSEHWQHCLPEGHVELAALIDARERDTPAMLEETAIALEQGRLASQNGTPIGARPALPAGRPCRTCCSDRCSRERYARHARRDRHSTRTRQACLPEWH